MRGMVYIVKNKAAVIFLIAMMMVATLSGCAVNEQASDSANEYYKINSDDAKIMMEQESNLVVLDVRTPEEFAEGYIQGSINIPDTDITETAEKMMPDKSIAILVYCRSGRRSALAAQDLSDLGYTNVYDFGGIIDWNYDVVTE
jgi:rhodanese-related sulfurtransferase